MIRSRANVAGVIGDKGSVGTDVAQYGDVKSSGRGLSTTATTRASSLVRLLLIGALTFLLSIGSQALAQSDPFGVVDTVVVEAATVQPGKSFAVSVRMFNDEQIAAFSIPLNYPSDLIEFDSVSFTNSRAISWSFLAGAHSPDEATILLGGLAIGDPPVPPGSGEIAKLFFRTMPDAQPGTMALIDSGFVPPAGYFELNTPNATRILPAFRPGLVAVLPTNLPPQFKPLADRSVNEGETLLMTVEASDPEGKSIKLSAFSLPFGAKFIDQGSGTGVLTWNVPFTGPGSSTSSPYTLRFVASDGEATTTLPVKLSVINRNRPPVLSVGTNLKGGAGDTIYIPFAATDPDFEAVTFSASGIPAASDFNPSNPGHLKWSTSVADTGHHSFTLIASDESGGTVSEQVSFELLPSARAELSISDEQALSGEFVYVDINVRNRVELSAFEFACYYDKTILTLISVEKDSTRISDWGVFDYVSTFDSKVFIQARSSASNPPTNLLDKGSGRIARLKFLTSSDLAFAGFFTRVGFYFMTANNPAENVVYEADGAMVPRNEIPYESGGVLVKRYDGLIGDLNLNSIAFEIADLVYFTNYFIDPINYPLDGARWLNSDINQDGTPATLGDLVMMIQIVTGGGGKLAGGKEEKEALPWEFASAGSESVYRLAPGATFAAALLVFEVSDAPAVVLPGTSLAGGELQVHQEGNLIRALIVEPSGGEISINDGVLLSFPLGSGITLVSQEFVDRTGAPLALQRLHEGVLPSEFTLEQNFPNPFNPQTTIAFTLPQAADVNLSIYNVLGEQVTILAEERLPAGRHEVVFNGADRSGRSLPSGIYFYRLRTDSFEATRKMVLLK